MTKKAKMLIQKNDRPAQHQPASLPPAVPAGTLSEAEIRQIVSEILG